MSEPVPQATIYFDSEVTFVCSKVSSTDPDEGPAEPVTEFRGEASVGELGHAIYQALTTVGPRVSPERFEEVIVDAFQRLEVESWEQLEKRYWMINIWLEPDGQIKFQTMRKWYRGGYLAMDSDYDFQCAFEESELGEAAVSAIRNLDRTTSRQR
ncbi:MAG: hypothetical protein KDA93_00105 [Planctomycetaceae bacterium]|nr:hypothetical protein [Planctomycetaceae bacterium]